MLIDKSIRDNDNLLKKITFFNKDTTDIVV